MHYVLVQCHAVHERCVALELALASGGAAVSGGTLSYDGARRLYLAAPQLLTDITYGVAARLRALAVAVAGTVEQAAAAVGVALGTVSLSTCVWSCKGISAAGP